MEADLQGMICNFRVETQAPNLGQSRDAESLRAGQPNSLHPGLKRIRGKDLLTLRCPMDEGTESAECRDGQGASSDQGKF